jgi:hypothetical protein
MRLLDKCDEVGMGHDLSDDSARDMGDGTTCLMQVCRYAKSGNCMMDAYDSDVGDDWRTPWQTIRRAVPCALRVDVVNEDEPGRGGDVFE